MKKVLGLSLLMILGGGKVAFAQLVLNCGTSGTLTRLEPPNKNIFLTTIPTQCTLQVQNSENVNVTISLSEPTLSESLTTGEKPDPSGTQREATLTYSHDGDNVTVNSGTPVNDTFLANSTIYMNVYMEIQRPKEFFAGDYTYQTDLNITAP